MGLRIKSAMTLFPASGAVFLPFEKIPIFIFFKNDTMKHLILFLFIALTYTQLLARPIDTAQYPGKLRNWHGFGSEMEALENENNPIANLKAGADFIQNIYPEVTVPLESRNYHSIRNKLHNAQIVFEREKRGRVAFLGGSITQGSGWRDSICAYLKNRFPATQFDFIQAGISSMGSTPGAFRFERDVLKNGKVDLLFEEAAVNDRTNGFSTETQILGMEGIVRHALESNPAMDIIVMHFVDPEKMTEYRKGIVPTEIQNHEKVAAYYQVSTINLAKEVTERIDNGEFSWEKDFKNLHPSPFGHHIYFQSMKTLLETCWSSFVAADDKITAYPLPAKLNQASYDKGILVPAVQAKLAKGWKAVDNWTPADKIGTRPDFTNVPMLVGQYPSKTLSYVFEGNAIGIAVAAGSDAGTIEYRIDKNPWKKQDLFTSWSSSLHLPWFCTLGYGLSSGKHKLQLRISPEKNSQSKGTACRIRYFYVNRL
jgi:sialidase-1